MALKRVEAGRAIILKQVIQGTPGKTGPQGKAGVTEVIHKVIHEVEQGEPGQKGEAPQHQVKNGEVRFQNPDGTWGKWIIVQPQARANGGGGLESVQYIPITVAAFTVNRSSLIVGHNIFGINFTGDVTVILPSGIDKNILMTFKDESNTAGINNITITTENQ